MLSTFCGQIVENMVISSVFNLINFPYPHGLHRILQVEIIDRNGELHIIGDKEGALKASSIIRELVQLSRRGTAIEEQSVDYAISIKKDKENLV